METNARELLERIGWLHAESCTLVAELLGSDLADLNDIPYSLPQAAYLGDLAYSLGLVLATVQVGEPLDQHARDVVKKVRLALLDLAQSGHVNDPSHRIVHSPGAAGSAGSAT